MSAPGAPSRAQPRPALAPLVDMAWLRSHDDVVLADVRWYLDGRQGHEAYVQGHIPGAVFVDLERSLSGDPAAGRGRHPLPSPEHFASEMASLGVPGTATVVAYDDQGGVIAARLVWMLRATGHEAALLDGGLGAYEGPLETGERHLPPATFDPAPWPAERLATMDDATNPANVVIDARSAERYHGIGENVDPRAGHIPGAVSLPCRDNLGPDGKMLPVPVLRRRLQAAGAGPGAPLVSYCGSGVTACHNLLAFELCGFGEGRLYAGSWSEYSTHPDRPLAT
jgi:thiosulfate/3-mercaptopyruvate sulfurtransferase